MKAIYCLAIYLFFSTSINAQELKLTIKVEGLKNTKGNLLIGLYNNSSNFPDKKYAMAGKIIPITNNIEIYTFKNLKPGKYAVAIIHDENNDGELSTNFIGIPKEGFGFSNNVLGRFGPPDFDKAAVDLKKDGTIEVVMKN